MKWFRFGRKRRNKKRKWRFNLSRKSSGGKRKRKKARSPFHTTNKMLEKMSAKEALDWAARTDYSSSYQDSRGVWRWKSSGRRVYKK